MARTGGVISRAFIYRYVFLSMAVAAIFLLGSGPGWAAEVAPASEAMVARAQLAAGDTARLQHVLAKARRGEAVTVGVIGGSITQGARASKADLRYGNLVAQWWREKFPRAAIQFVNAGIGATQTNYGALRASRDLLGAKPDFVIVEYAVNDPNTQDAAETLEGLVRQVLKQPNRPAVLLLFMMKRNGANAQEWFTKVGEHYRLPMVNYRDAFWPEIEAKRLTWEDISPDEVHPNDRGHADAARFVSATLERGLASLPADAQLPEISPLPAPRFTDAFEFTSLMEASALKPALNEGWVFDEADKCWKTQVPGSVLEFEVEGRTIFTSHYVIRGPMGRAKVTVDGAAPVTLEGWFDGTWGGYRQTNRIARDLPPGKHRLRFELSADKNAGSEGTEFRLLGLGTAGISPAGKAGE